jgi:hypothetical protein
LTRHGERSSGRVTLSSKAYAAKENDTVHSEDDINSLSSHTIESREDNSKSDEKEYSNNTQQTQYKIMLPEEGSSIVPPVPII